MTTFVSRVQQEQLLHQLPSLRAQYQAAAPGAPALAAALDLVESYQSLGLGERAALWLSVCEGSVSLDQPAALSVRLLVAQGVSALALEEFGAFDRVAGRLAALESEVAESELVVLAVLVQHALLRAPDEAFALLERAFRSLRHHPSSVWASRFLGWRAQWLESQQREADAYSSAKKALVQAQIAESEPDQLALWLLLARSKGSPRPKALRAAHSALELAVVGGYPQAEAEAHRVLSRLTSGPRESDSAREFRASVEVRETDLRFRAAWDRDCRAEDQPLLAHPGEGKRSTDAQVLGQVCQILASGGDLAASLDQAYPVLCELLSADIFGIGLWEPGQEALDYSLFIEEGRRTRVGLIPVGSHRSLGAWCFRHRKAVRINDIDREYRLYLKELSRLADHRPKSMLFQPLVSERGLLGIVTVQAFSRGAYDPTAEAYLSVLASVLSLRLQSEGRPGA